MTRRGTVLLAGLVIVVAALAAYHNSFATPFVFDDAESIAHNPTIRRLWPPGPLFSPPGARGQTVGGRPVLNLTLAVDYAIGGLDVGPYHATNLLIHLLAGLTLFGLIRRTLRDRPEAALLAFGAALLWTVHPLQTESVTYVIQRAESLMGLCYLLTLYGFVRYQEGTGGGGAGRHRAWAGLSVVACFLGMGTKEVMVSAPVIVLCYDRTFGSGGFGAAWRRHRGYYLALGASWLWLAALVLPSHQRGGSTGFGSGIPWAHYVLLQFPAVAHYLWLALWPHPLVFDYGTDWSNRVGWALPILGVTALAAGSAVAFFWPDNRRWSVRAAGFAGLWFCAILAPTSLIPGNRQTMAEHRMYLALAPLLVVGLAGLARLRPRPFRRPGLTLALIGLLAVGATGLTIRRNRTYRSDLSLWSDTAAKVPNNPYAQGDVGVALDERGDEAGALARYELSLTLNPNPHDLERAHNNMGLALAKLGRLPEAEREFAAAVALDPAYGDARDNYGNVLRREGRRAEAAAQLQAAIGLRADDANAWFNLAALEVETGQAPAAVAAYRRAEALLPDNADLHLQLANVLAETRRWTEAIPEYEAVLRLAPGNAVARDHLARVRAALGP